MVKVSIYYSLSTVNHSSQGTGMFKVRQEKLSMFENVFREKKRKKSIASLKEYKNFSLQNQRVSTVHVSERMLSIFSQCSLSKNESREKRNLLNAFPLESCTYQS